MRLGVDPRVDQFHALVYALQMRSLLMPMPCVIQAGLSRLLDGRYEKPVAANSLLSAAASKSPGPWKNNVIWMHGFDLKR